jgi:hypothetical protein
VGNSDPIRRGLRDQPTALVLVGFSSAVGLIHGLYGIVIRIFQDHALHARHYWHQPLGVAVLLTLGWLCSLTLLVPAGSIGAAELSRSRPPRRARAAGFVALLCLGAVGQYWAIWRASHSGFVALVHEDWLHDGRPWYALSALLAVVVFVGAAILFKPSVAPDGARAHPALDGGAHV